MRGGETELLVVMYHLVHGPGTPHIAGLPGPDREEFAAQLRRLQLRYPPISYGELVESRSGRRTLPARCSLITFDDGTSDHYRNAFPVLRELGLSAVFFVISRCVEERELTPVHARHLITARISASEFRQRFLEALQGSDTESASQR